MPSDVPNPTDYRSGHYQRYGLNVQAMCNPNLRFAYISVAGPGKMNDARAFRRLEGLKYWLEHLEDGFFCSGDNAYPLKNNILIPYSGSQRFHEYRDVCNFFFLR